MQYRSMNVLNAFTAYFFIYNVYMNIFIYIFHLKCMYILFIYITYISIDAECLVSTCWREISTLSTRLQYTKALLGLSLALHQLDKGARTVYTFLVCMLQNTQ